MKKTTFILAILFLFSLPIFFSCASGPSGRASTIEEAYPERFEKTIIGMDVSEFKTVWPEAKRAGISEEGEIYEFRYGHILLYAPDYYITTKFYFFDNKLVKYESTKGL
jgi:hypothetical protein